MTDYRGFDILDYLVLIVKWRKLLLSVAFISLILSYLAVYFFIDERYDSSSLIIPAENSDLTGISSLMKSFSNLPISIPGISGSESTTDIYTTIIYSRTSIVDLINKFDLSSEYQNKYFDETIKAVRKDISADETDKGAYEITVRASSPNKAASMVNYIVDKLNKTLIQLNTLKAKENRIFLENRYSEIKNNLVKSEDSLVNFQKKSGLIFAEEQAKTSVEAYTKLESEVTTKQIELSIMTKIFGANSPLTQEAKIAADEYKDKFENLKRGKESSELLLPIDNLPLKAMNYLRYFSEVEINKKLMEFIIPLYEQSKFEEQKSIPYIQIIDRGVAPSKKSYPPRILFSIIITFFIFLLILIILIMKEKIKNSENDNVKYISQNIFHFRNERT
jgi:tyrosine-protein kinase Etk/Wzc